jgi:uncharacterized membrane protein YtjA (UPF0391 family)
MLYYTLVFPVIALLAGLPGFFGVAGAVANIAQGLLLLLAIPLVVGLLRRVWIS